MVDPLPCWFNVSFAMAAVGGSAFYGIKAVEIFDVPTKDRKWSWLQHQRWFNFLGASVGWIALWFLARDVNAAGLSIDFTSQQVLLGILAFAGVTGHVPLGFSGVLQGVTELAKRAMDFVAGGKSS